FVAPTPTDQFENITIKMKCTDQDGFIPSNGFESGAVTVYTAPGAISFVNGWNSFQLDNPYNWDSTKNLLIEICYTNAAPGAATPVVFYTNSGFVSTLFQSNTSGSACALNTGVPVGSFVRPDIRLETILAPEGDFQYIWHSGWQLSDSLIKNPVAYVDKSYTYSVSTIGRNGCPFFDTVNIYNPEPKYTINPMDTSICLGDETSIILGNF